MDGTVKTDLMNWKCLCGAGLKASVEDVALGTVKCPDCGAAVSPEQQEIDDFSDSDDTQMVSLQEMAQMAQDGVDLDVSGEWNTSPPSDSPHEKED
jgi:DNA replicative helicase MCM subunit Mcm2 (Cdc46/Mcm family)